MAAKKSTTQAEKAASKSKRKDHNSVSEKSKTNKKEVPQEEPVRVKSMNQIPTRVITSATCLVLFILFLVMLLKPDGALLKLFNSVVQGLFGKIGFYIAIPGMLYMFIIHAFSGKRPIIMRSVCLLVFIVMCGCVAHLILNPENLPVKFFPLLGVLYRGGSIGTTGGVICGGIAIVMKLLLGSVLPYFVFILTAIFTLFATFQITIPSVIRAIKNRPRAEWEEEDEQAEPQEPAAVVINHIANKHIEHEERRRARRAEKAQIDIPLDDDQESGQSKKPAESRADEFMRQIDNDVEAPVAASATPVEADESDVVLTNDQDSKAHPVAEEPMEESVEELFKGMPLLVLDHKEEEIPEEEMQEEEIPEEEPVSEPLPVPQVISVEKPGRKVTAQDAQDSAAQVAQEIADAQAIERPMYCFPPIDLLKNFGGAGADGTEEMRENTRRLNETLESFKIEAHIINVTRGPSVTRYEVELDKGVRLNKLTSCADDIALSLGASGVRIAAVPGKISVVGIEVPNRSVTTVSLREVIGSTEFESAKSKSSFAVGKDIGGSCIVGNIAKLPHMLIAGTTGSGKSVCMNSIIISLLYKASPEDVKLIMVDPKMVELGIYNGIPHLLIPVVTDPKKAAGSLQWAVTEMMRRYKAMSDAGVRDLESYNGIMESQEGTKLPQVVVIIDELADLMLVAAKEVEESICRIAQMGRASGIHLVIATQRPSADVITGLMKANIPSRIAFAVASAMESRIILDTQGAEKLVGKGDMLYAPIGSGKPKRVQGCFVSDSEVESVANYVKNNYNVDYDQQVMEEIERKAAQTGNKPAVAPDPEPNAEELMGDEMLPAAVDVILETGQASVSMLQRRLKLGYARAARIVDEMEERGIVGPFKGSKPREILVTKEQWEAMKAGEPAQLEFDDLPVEDEEEFVPEEFE